MLELKAFAEKMVNSCAYVVYVYVYVYNIMTVEIVIRMVTCNDDIGITDPGDRSSHCPNAFPGSVRWSLPPSVRQGCRCQQMVR